MIMICIENCHLLKFVHFQGTYQTETTHTIIMSYCVNLSRCDFYQRINKLLKPILKSVYIAVGYINQKDVCMYICYSEKSKLYDFFGYTFFITS